MTEHNKKTVEVHYDLPNEADLACEFEEYIRLVGGDLRELHKKGADKSGQRQKEDGPDDGDWLG